MVTIFRSAGLRIVIFTNDHHPAHVHVFGDGQVKINLIGRNGRPELISAEAMTAGDIRRAMRLVQDNLALLQERWEAIHGLCH